jgi:phospholipid/cholesterol/gamma-HCH transport system substrate-binding protein
MITRKVRIQLLVFTALAVIASALIFFQYARVPALLGVGQEEVSATFTEGAGLYPQANVTYRGVTVGKVTAVRLAPDGVEADLRISSDAKVPADVEAVIKSVSAIGEQYVDLLPRSTGGARLKSGAKIPVEHTRVPRQIATVLDDVDSLLSSVPADSLTVVIDEAEKGFTGLGPDLARLNVNAQALINDASENYDETSLLIKDAETTLDSQLVTSDSIRNWTSDLAGFSRELRRNDKQVRSILRSVPMAAREVRGLFDDLSRPLPRFLESADVTADLLAAYRKPLEQVLVIYPMVAANNIQASGPHRGGQFGLTFKTIANYPGGCSEGWPKAGEPLGARASTELEDMDFPRGSFCRIRQSDPRVARGTRNLECFEPGSPDGRRAATVEQCRGAGYSTDAAPFTYVPVKNPLAPSANNLLDLLGGSTKNPVHTKEMTWQSLLLTPLTR